MFFDVEWIDEDTVKLIYNDESHGGKYYEEFESRVEIIGGTVIVEETPTGKKRSVTIKSSAKDIVRAAVDSKIGKFTKREIVNICPSISEKSVELGLKNLQEEGYIKKYGTGRSTFYSKVQ